MDKIETINITLNVFNMVLILALICIELKPKRGKKTLRLAKELGEEAAKVLYGEVLPKAKKGRVFNPKKDVDHRMSGKVVDFFDD